VNVYVSGEAYIVDNDRRSDFSLQTHIHIYAYIKYEALYLTVCAFLFGICCSHVVSVVFFYELNQVIALCSKPKHRKRCKFIQCLNKEKRDEDKVLKG
jgi:hypothetical protein